LRQVFEIAERVPISGYDIAILNGGKGPESVDLQLKNEVIGVEGLRLSRPVNGLSARGMIIDVRAA